MTSKAKHPSVLQASLTVLTLAVWISFGIFWLEADLHGILLIGIVFVAANCLWLGADYKAMQAAMLQGLDRAMPAMLVFLMIGVVIVTFIQSGTVGTLIYYGLKFMDPGIFLPAGLILCSLMSLAVGTSWGTVATGGIVLIGIGGAMGMPLAMVAGMIVSGASFGDKMSPVSDTTNLAALSADTDLYRHIRSMMYTTVPSYLIALAAFSWVGWSYADQPLPEAELNTLLTALDATFEINPIVLLPMIVLLGLSMRGMKPEAAMMLAALVAAVIAFFVQGHTLAEIVTGFYGGAKIESGVATLDPLLNRGGITDMSWTFTLSFVAISLGSLLQYFGFLEVLMAAILRMIKRVGGLISSTILVSVFANLTLGESYISMILTGQMFKEKYNELEVDRAMLSRSLEEGGTLVTGLIPWTTTGVFFAATLGVATLDYAAWAFLNLINPLLGILFAMLGIAIWKTKRQSGEEAAQA
ncbi:MAG: Na+/H+ antiporter NhaC [Pseudomonadota bacterium]